MLNDHAPIEIGFDPVGPRRFPLHRDSPGPQPEIELAIDRSAAVRTLTSWGRRLRRRQRGHCDAQKGKSKQEKRVTNDSTNVPRHG